MDSSRQWCSSYLKLKLLLRDQGFDADFHYFDWRQEPARGSVIKVMCAPRTRINQAAFNAALGSSRPVSARRLQASHIPCVDKDRASN
jgi:hypothetical protein